MKILLSATKEVPQSPQKVRSRRRTASRTQHEVIGNKPGDTLEHQWPEIESVYIASQVMIQELKANPTVLISEKLDGSNLSVSSDGIIASRRKVILAQPSLEDLKKSTFAGQSLSTIEPVMKAVQAMKDSFAKNLDKLEQVIVFGEWLQSGTASSKEDKFLYSQRGLIEGHLYAFGLGLVFKSDDVKAVEILKNKGFVPVVQSKNFITLNLNKDLKDLFDQYKIKTVPITLNRGLFVDIFGQLADDLLQHKVEGFVISLPNKILKWKGYEENDPRRVETFIDITDACKIAKAIGPLNQVLQESILYNAHGRKRYLDPNMTNAFNSARSKFPRLDDILSNYQGDRKAKIIEGYKFTIIDEITKDFGKAFGCTRQSIEAFVNREIKL